MASVTILVLALCLCGTVLTALELLRQNMALRKTLAQVLAKKAQTAADVIKPAARVAVVPPTQSGVEKERPRTHEPITRKARVAWTSARNRAEDLSDVEGRRIEQNVPVNARAISGIEPQEKDHAQV